MLSFISTFPPILCGIGTYTSYLVSKMPDKTCKVCSFKPNEFSKAEDTVFDIDEVLYEISISNPRLPSRVKGDVLWFQHSFGMWGKGYSALLQMIEEAKARKKKVVVSFHTIHFESRETGSRMRLMEEELLYNILPRVDAATVFTDGAYGAVTRGFPQYEHKVVVLRHGVHLYQRMGKREARKSLLRYLIDRAEIPITMKQTLRHLYYPLFTDEAILVGNFGFITHDKDPIQLYRIGQLLQDRLPSKKVITVFIGKIQKRNDCKMEKSLPILDHLKGIHDGVSNIFVEDFLPEGIFPIAFEALDFSIFWCHSATQSGRMAHALGAGTCVLGRRIEGIGETLDLAGLPATLSIEGLAEKMVSLVLDPRLREDTQRTSWSYAQEFSFENQAKKHLLLEEAVRSGEEIPMLDRSKPDFAFYSP